MNEHTDVHQVQLVCYGLKAFAWSRAIRDGMCWPEVKSIFQQASLYYVPDIPAPVPAPELVEGSWWTRFDVKVTFNEGVRIERSGATKKSIHMEYRPPFCVNPSISKYSALRWYNCSERLK